MHRRLSEYLRQLHIAARDSIHFIDGMSYADFQADTKTQRAVTMNLVILVEAAAKVEEHFPSLLKRIQRSPGQRFEECETV